MQGQSKIGKCGKNGSTADLHLQACAMLISANLQRDPGWIRVHHVFRFKANVPTVIAAENAKNT